MSIKSSDIGSVPYAGNTQAYTRNSFLYHTLEGIRGFLRKMLNLERVIEYKFTDAIKRGYAVKNKIQYPRYFIQVQSINRLPNRQNSLAMARSGMYSVKPKGEGLREATVFPVELRLEFHYLHSDAEDLFQMAENLTVLGSSVTKGIKVTIDESFETVASIKFEEGIDVTEFEMTSPIDPQTSEIVMPFTVNSWVGFITDRPWVHVLDAPLEDAAVGSFEVNKDPL